MKANVTNIFGRRRPGPRLKQCVRLNPGDLWRESWLQPPPPPRTTSSPPPSLLTTSGSEDSRMRAQDSGSGLMDQLGTTPAGQHLQSSNHLVMDPTLIATSLDLDCGMTDLTL